MDSSPPVGLICSTVVLAPQKCKCLIKMYTSCTPFSAWVIINALVCVHVCDGTHTFGYAHREMQINQMEQLLIVKGNVRTHVVLTESIGTIKYGTFFSQVNIDMFFSFFFKV